MNIIDTSLWLEYFAGTPLDESIINAISNSNEMYVPTICLYEVRKKFLNDNDADKAVTAINIMKNSTVININSNIALLASDISKQYKLPMADSIIYATAELYNAIIYTQDRHFENLKRVYYFAKI